MSNYHSSGDYWHFSGNSGTFNGNSAVGPVDTIFGITGFDTVTLTGYISGYEDELFATGINSGIIYNLYTQAVYILQMNIIKLAEKGLFLMTIQILSITQMQSV